MMDSILLTDSETHEQCYDIIVNNCKPFVHPFGVNAVLLCPTKINGDANIINEASYQIYNIVRRVNYILLTDAS